MPLRLKEHTEIRAEDEAIADSLMADVHVNIYKTEERSLRGMHEAIRIYKGLNRKEKLAWAYLMLARYCQLTNNYFAIFDFAEKIDDCDSADDRLQADINALLSEAHLRLSSPGVALEHARKCLEIAERIQDDSRLAEAFVRLAEIYSDLDREDLALDYYNKAYARIHGIHSPYTHIYLLAFLCDMKCNENRIDEAYTLLKQIEVFKPEFSEYLFMLAFDLRKARIFAKEGRYEDARMEFNRIFAFAKKHDDHIRMSNLEFDLAQVELASGNIEKAEQMCRSSIEDLGSVNVLLALDKRYKLLARIYETQNRLADALAISKKLYYFKVGYLENDLTKLLAYMRKASLYENVKKEKEATDKVARIKDQFLANMSHEIRTPMNAIVGMANLMSNTPLNTIQQKYLNGIRQSADNLLVIINDILDFSKIEAGKVTFEQIPFRVQDVFQNVYDVLQFKAEEKKLLFEYDVGPGVPAVLIGDPVRLNQVVMNLASNALKFTAKGSVQMRCRLISIQNARAALHFEVSDSGIGIADDKLNDIFKSFTQATAATTRQFGGSGLGLTISKQLVDLQGGSIAVRSKLGEGSVFYFDINYQIGEQSALDPESQDEQIQLEGTRILLVEDNSFNQIVAQDTLESMIQNPHIDIAENGAIALERLKQHTYDIVLMDIQMPVMDGYQASRAIRELEGGSRIPIIALTANAMKEEVQRCKDAGMNDFVTKPFDPDDLISKIYRLVRNGK